MVAAALLHDVLHCSMMTEARLRDFVPAEVANIVSNVSRMSGICEVSPSPLDQSQVSKTLAGVIVGSVYCNSCNLK
jgi:(p)ppGpp synthase/HD superfamily hydrolase